MGTHGMALGMVAPCTARERAQNPNPSLARTRGKTTGGTSWSHSHNTESAQGHSSLLILCFPLSSSLEKHPERSQGETRADPSVQRNLSLSLVCCETSTKLHISLSRAAPARMEVSVQDHGKEMPCCLRNGQILLSAPNQPTLHPQVYKNAGIPLPKRAGSGRNTQKAQSSWATTTTNMGVRCLWGQFCAIFLRFQF